MNHPDPDLVLVERARGGEAAAFDELVEKHSRKLYGLVYHMCGSHEDANDILQDTFTKAYTALGKFQGKSSFYTWIYTIATNMTLNFLKKRKRRAAWSLDDADGNLQNDDAMVDPRHEANPRSQARIHELQKKLNEAMARLSQDHRAVVVMFDIQGMPHAEISVILGVSEGTVRSRLYYAHQQLQAHLSEYLST